MRDILSDLVRWQKSGSSIALATVVETWGSAPRRAGAKMALTPDGRITGSVSGGCVENAVAETGIESLNTNRPSLLHFSVADEIAWGVGLACGGSIDIFVKPLDERIFEAVRSVIESEQQAVLGTIIRGPDEMLGREMLIRGNEHLGDTLGDELNDVVLNLANEVLSSGASHRVALNKDVDIFLEAILPPPSLVIVGAVHIAVALASLAKTLGYHTILIDPRQAWGNEERFPNVDRLIQAWPEEAFNEVNITISTAIATLTHDPKLDDPALMAALKSPAFYVGALGSKRTNANRRARLLQNGLTESQLSRLHAPIGLDIHAQTPEEIALAIMAEIVQAHRRENPVEVKEEVKSVQSLLAGR